MKTNLRDDSFWNDQVQEPPASWDNRAGEPAVTGISERVETRGRSRALQALYAADLRDFTRLRRIAAHVFDDLAIDAGERAVASQIVATVSEFSAEIDSDLTEVTANWKFERLGAIERSVLRLAAAELRRGVTPVKVVIQEALRLAERFGSEKSARFVNGVLDAHARRIGKL